MAMPISAHNLRRENVVLPSSRYERSTVINPSAHAREGYSSHFVSVCHFSILEKAPFSGLKLTSVYILGDDLSALNVALF